MKAPANVEIRPATSADIPAVADVLAVALRETEIAHWLVPDRAARHWVYDNYFRLVTPWLVMHGTAYVVDDGAAAALWATCHGRFEPDITDYDVQLAEACGAATPRFVELDEAMHDRHPDVAHEYLAFLGVAEERRGHGIGTALLTNHHSLLDAAASPAYLTATGLRNAALYERTGYRHRGAYPIASGSPPLYPMWRTPLTG
jgi:GNAT superfamily N-acetyltransferase